MAKGRQEPGREARPSRRSSPGTHCDSVVSKSVLRRTSIPAGPRGVGGPQPQWTTSTGPTRYDSATMPASTVHSLLLLAAVLLVLGALLAAAVITLMAWSLLRPPRMTDGKAAWVLKRLSPGDLGL